MLVQELRVVVDPAAGFRVRYQLLSGDPSPRISVGAGPFNNSDSADAWGGNHSVDAIFRLDTGLTGNAAEGVGPVWYVDGNGLELQRHAFNWRPFYNGASVTEGARGVLHSAMSAADRHPAGTYFDPAYPVSCQYVGFTAGIFMGEEREEKRIWGAQTGTPPTPAPTASHSLLQPMRLPPRPLAAALPSEEASPLAPEPMASLSASSLPTRSAARPSSLGRSRSW